MERRIDELEVKLAFQDQLLNDLDGVIRELATELEGMRLALGALSEEVRALSPEAEDTKPPHY